LKGQGTEVHDDKDDDADINDKKDDDKDDDHWGRLGA
jgi:hypothetical protein